MTDSVATSISPRKSNLGEIVLSFTQHVDSLAASLPLVLATISVAHKVRDRELSEFLKLHGEVLDETDGIVSYRIPPASARETVRLQRREGHAKLALQTIPRSFVVSLVSQLDVFFGNLVRELFVCKPELFKTTNQQIPLDRLFEFNSIEDAKAFVIEKEVELLLRSSHTEQFETLEKLFNTTLRKDLSVWSTFIELTERRNLFVHCNGKVSAQYRNVCLKNGYTGTIPELGTVLEASGKYFVTA